MKIDLRILAFIWMSCRLVACTLSFDAEVHDNDEATGGVDSGAIPTQDGCPDDPNKNDPGMCGCGVPDEDADGDGVEDCHDDCPLDENKIFRGSCGCGKSEDDRDGDGVPDCLDDDTYDTESGTEADSDSDTDTQTETDPDTDTDIDLDNDPFSYCRSIVINHHLVGLDNHGALPKTGFPLLVSLSGAWLKTSAADPVNGRVASSNGHDIIFRDANGSTKLYHEVEQYNGTKGILVSWVRVDSLSKAKDTTIYICYGNTNVATPTATPEKVWDAHFSGVWHLSENAADEGSGAIHYDATAKNNNGIQNGNGGCAGKIAGAQDFDGKDDFLNVGNSKTLMPRSITVSAWVKQLGAGDAVDWQDIIGNQDFDGVTGGYLLYIYPDNSGIWWRVLGDAAIYEVSAEVVTSAWHLYTGTFSGTTSRIYVDGVLVSSRSDAALGETSMQVYFADHGSFHGGGSGLFDGIIDEVRISGIARSPDWIATSYNNQSDTSIGQGKFLRSMGPES